MILISPSEPAELRQTLKATSSPLCENLGADILAPTMKGLLGIQRKEASDFVASLEDGRLARELPLLVNGTTLPVLLLEGVFNFNSDDHLHFGNRVLRYTRQSIRNLARSISYVNGVSVEYSTSFTETPVIIKELIDFVNKEHKSLLKRPKLQSAWGKPTPHEALGYFFQGIPSVGYTKPSQLTVKLFMQEWQEVLKSTSSVKPKTQGLYEYLTRVHILPTLGDVRLSQLRTSQIQNLYAQKSKEGKIGARTIEMIHVCLHKALVYAMQTGILSRNPMDAVVKPKSQRREMKPVNEHGLNMFLDEAKKTEYYALDATYELTGIRRNEGLALPWGNVDLASRTLTITRTMDFKKEKGKPAVITYSMPKTKSSLRTLDLCQINCSILAIHRKKQDEARAYNGLPPTTDDDLVFCHTDGSPYLPCTISHHWNKITRRCGMEGVRLHDIRHSYASILGKQGVPLKVIQEKLGHSSPTFTASQYMHLFSGMGRAASDVFEKALLDSRKQEKSARKETPRVQIS